MKSALTNAVILPSNPFFPISSTKQEMGSIRLQNHSCNQTMNGLASFPKWGLDPTQPTHPATKHTVI